MLWKIPYECKFIIIHVNLIKMPPLINQVVK